MNIDRSIDRLTQWIEPRRASHLDDALLVVPNRQRPPRLHVLLKHATLPRLPGSVLLLLLLLGMMVVVLLLLLLMVLVLWARRC